MVQIIALDDHRPVAARRPDQRSVENALPGNPVVELWRLGIVLTLTPWLAPFGLVIEPTKAVADAPPEG